MEIDDEIQLKLQQLAHDSGVSLQVILRNATVVAAGDVRCRSTRRVAAVYGDRRSGHFGGNWRHWAWEVSSTHCGAVDRVEAAHRRGR
jgi:hypothetical protein